MASLSITDLRYTEEREHLIRDVQKSAGITLAFVLLFAVLRIYVRIWVVKDFGASDWVMVAACAITAILVGNWAAMIISGHMPSVGVNNVLTCMKWGYALYILSCATIKISLATTMLRIFSTHHPARRFIVYLCTGINCFIGLVSLILAVSSCAPVYFGTCSVVRYHDGLSLSFSVSNILTEVVLGMMSVEVLWNMTMTLAAKLSATLVFMTGSLGGVASILRILAYFKQKGDVVQLAGYTKWGIIESSSCIIAVCLFALRPLFRHMLDPKGNGASRSNSGFLGRVMPMLRKGHVAPLQTHGLFNNANSKNYKSRGDMMQEVKSRPPLAIIIKQDWSSFNKAITFQSSPSCNATPVPPPSLPTTRRRESGGDGSVSPDESRQQKPPPSDRSISRDSDIMAKVKLRDDGSDETCPSLLEEGGHGG